jgi:hypothetical protein
MAVELLPSRSTLWLPSMFRFFSELLIILDDFFLWSSTISCRTVCRVSIGLEIFSACSLVTGDNFVHCRRTTTVH